MADLAATLSDLSEQRWFIPAVVGGGVGGVILLVRLARKPAAPQVGDNTPTETPADPPPAASGLQAALFDQYQASTQQAIADQAAAVDKKFAAATTHWTDLLAPIGQGIGAIQTKDTSQDTQLANQATLIAQLSAAVQALSAKLGGGVVNEPTLPGGGGGGSTAGGDPLFTVADWKAYAANAGLLKGGIVEPKRSLAAGSELTVYKDSTRMSPAFIRLPKAYNGAADTKRFSFLTGTDEPLLVRAARKTADVMAASPKLDSQAVMLTFLRNESKGNGGWSGTGFTPGPADVAAGYP